MGGLIVAIVAADARARELFSPGRLRARCNMGADPITLINFRRSLTPLMECLTSDVKDYLTRPLCPFFNGAEYWMHPRWYPWVRRGRALLRLFKNVACGERCCARCDDGVCGSRKRSLTFPLGMGCSLERLYKFIMYGNCLLSMSTTRGWSCHGGGCQGFFAEVYSRAASRNAWPVACGNSCAPEFLCFGYWRASQVAVRFCLLRPAAIVY